MPPTNDFHFYTVEDGHYDDDVDAEAAKRGVTWEFFKVRRRPEGYRPTSETDWPEGHVLVLVHVG